MKSTLIFIISLISLQLAISQKVGVGTLTPAELLSVGESSQFRVNSAGNIVRINNVPIDFPISQGSENTVLTNDGTGKLNWKKTIPPTSIVISPSDNSSILINDGYALLGKFELLEYQSYLGTFPGTWAPIGNLVNAPSARWGHSAVWTGTEMIIWGGTNDNNIYPNAPDFNAIYKYNPTTGSWIKITTFSGTPPPNVRAFHSAVWNGSEMLIYGGEYRSSAGILTYNDGYRFNPSSNKWTQFAGNGTSGAIRSRHSAVWTGTEMIIWGGSSDYIGLAFNPLSSIWTLISSGPAPTSNHSSIWTGTEMIIWGGAGGITGRYQHSNGAWIFPINPTSGTYSKFIQGGSAVWTGTEMVLWAGDYGIGAKYNPSTNIIGNIGNSPGPIQTFGQTAIWNGSEMIVFGGRYYPTPWFSDTPTQNFLKLTLTGSSKSYSTKSLRNYYLYQKS